MRESHDRAIFSLDFKNLRKRHRLLVKYALIVLCGNSHLLSLLPWKIIFKLLRKIYFCLKMANSIFQGGIGTYSP